MTTTLWKQATNGDWNNAADWSAGAPSSTTTATIAGPGSFLVTLFASGTVGSLILAAPGAEFYDEGTLFVAGTLALQSGTLALGYGDITGGTLALKGGLFQSQGGTLTGVTVQGPLTLSGAESSLLIQGGLTLQGTGGAGRGSLALTGAYSALDFIGSQTLDNATISIGAAAGQQAQGGAASLGVVQGAFATTGATLTLGHNLWLRGVAGQGAIALGGNAPFGPNLPDVLINQGTITAGAQGECLTISGAGSFANQGTIGVSNGATLRIDTPFSNTGTIAVSNATLSLGGTMASSLLSNLGAISIGAGDLRIDGTLINPGTLQLGAGTTLGAEFGAVSLAGTISGGTVADHGGGLSFAPGTGVLDHVRFAGTLNLAAAGTLTLDSGTSITQFASGTGDGTIICTGAASALLLRGTETLDHARITLGNATAQSSIATTDAWLASTATTATIGPHATIVQQGRFAAIEALGWSAVPGVGLADTLINQGTITASAQGGQLTLGGYGTILNQGSIAVSGNDTLCVSVLQFANAGLLTAGPGGTILLGQPAIWMGAAPAWSNAGRIAVGGGTLVLGGALATSQLGTITETSGAVVLAGTLSNIGATLALGGTGALQLRTLSLSGTIAGGTIIDSAGALAATASGAALLDGVAYRGTLALGAGATLRIRHGLSLAGIASVTGAGSVLDFEGSQTFANARIMLGAAGQSATLAVLHDPGQAGGSTLTLGASASITQSGQFATIGSSAGQAGDSIVSDATITAAVAGGTLTLAGPSFINHGVIAVGAGETLCIGATIFANTGAVNVSGGTLSVTGSITLAELGRVNLTNGAVAVAGTLDLGGGTLTIGRGTAIGRLLLTGTIAGGTIVDTGGGLAPAAGATLNAVTYRGTLDLSRPFAALAIAGGINAGGPILLTGAQSRLTAAATETIDHAQISLGSVAQSYNGQKLAAPELAAAAGAQLTLGPATTLTLAGTAGTLGDAGLGQWSDGIVNLGRILAASPGTLTLGASFLTSNGTIAATGGGAIAIGDTGFTNAGLLSIGAGASVQLSLFDFYAAPNAGPVQAQNTGTIALLGGILVEQTAHGLFPPVPLANRPGGIIEGHGALATPVANNGTIQAQNGTLLLSQSVSGAGLLAIDPGATLELAGPVLASQTVRFTSTAGTLKLDNPATFAGHLANAGATDAIDLPGQTLTGLSLSAGTLVLNTQAQTYRLAATTPLAGALAASHDATGGALIHLTPQGGGHGNGTTTIAATQPNMLFWAAPEGDIFQGTAANLHGAAIGDWTTADSIDITGLAGASLTVAQAGGLTTLSIGNATQTTSLSLAGMFAASSFHLGSDGNGGTSITFHP